MFQIAKKTVPLHELILAEEQVAAEGGIGTTGRCLAHQGIILVQAVETFVMTLVCRIIAVATHHVNIVGALSGHRGNPAVGERTAVGIGQQDERMLGGFHAKCHSQFVLAHIARGVRHKGGVESRTAKIWFQHIRCAVLVFANHHNHLVARFVFLLKKNIKVTT